MNLKSFKEKIFKAKFLRKVRKAQSILILSHGNPDVDAISSMLLMEQIINFYAPNRQIKIIAQGKRLKSYEFIPGYEELHISEEIASEIDNPEFDLIILLDASEYKRFSLLEKLNLEGKNTLCIDHHPTHADKFKLYYVDTLSVATAEILSRIFFNKKLFQSRFPALIALLGILDDSGFLRFIYKGNSGVLKTVLKIIDNSEVQLDEPISMLSKYSLNQAEIYSDLFKNIKTINDKVVGNILYTALSDELRQNKEISQERTKTTTDFNKFYLGNLKDHPLGFMLHPKYDEKQYGLSIVCADELTPMARLVALELGGGGHDRAAGARLDIDPNEVTMEEVVKHIVEKARLARKKYDKLKKS